MRLRLVLAVLALAALVWSIGAPMAKAEEYVCSPMTGRLVDTGGGAVANVTVRREWNWRGKSGSDTTTTDAEGRFGFDAVPAKRGLFGRLPAEEAVVQRYFADVAGGPFEFLFVSSRGLDLNSETDGQAFNVRCTVGAEQGFGGVHWGTCTLAE